MESWNKSWTRLPLTTRPKSSSTITKLPLNLRTALRQGTALLEDAAVAAPRLTAEVLLGHAMHVDRPYFYAHPEQELLEVERIHYGRYLHERMLGKPTQYITRKQEFYGREFRVTPDVLIPRPETELLVEVSLPFATGKVVDVGCGSGAIAVTMALESRAHIYGVDISPTALAVAAHNAKSQSASVSLVCTDLLAAFPDECFDLVVSNPPYVAAAARETLQREVRDWEPTLALIGGEDGLDIYRRLIPQAWRVLRPGGRLALELGFDSLPAVAAMLPSSTHYPDLAGIPRVIVCQKR